MAWTVMRRLEMPNPIRGPFRLFHCAREGSLDDRKCHGKTPPVTMTFTESNPARVLSSASPSAAATLSPVPMMVLGADFALTVRCRVFLKSQCVAIMIVE